MKLHMVWLCVKGEKVTELDFLEKISFWRKKIKNTPNIFSS